MEWKQQQQQQQRHIESPSIHPSIHPISRDDDGNQSSADEDRQLDPRDYAGLVTRQFYLPFILPLSLY
jgi:hypothetical protein